MNEPLGGGMLGVSDSIAERSLMMADLCKMRRVIDDGRTSILGLNELYECPTFLQLL